MARKKEAKRSRGDADKETNIHDVLIKIIDTVYSLLNSGNIIGVILLFIFAEIFYVTYKLPPESVDGYVGMLFALLRNDGFYAIPLTVALVFSAITNVIQAKVYREHIHTLAEFRKTIVYGLEAKELKTLDTHRTSGIDIRGKES